MLHLPILRFGQPYRSLDVATVPDFRSREPYVAVSQANGGLVRRDGQRRGASLNRRESRGLFLGHASDARRLERDLRRHGTIRRPPGTLVDGHRTPDQR